MRIVMDFDGIYTDPTEEGKTCSKLFRDKILSLNLKEVELDSLSNVDSWLGELRARVAGKPFDYGWRSEGRISAFAFEDPFIRNIGLADYLDELVKLKDARAVKVLSKLRASEKIQSFGDLSTWSFHQLSAKKAPDPQTKSWVLAAIDKGHEVFIVSNSSTQKIDDFLNQCDYPVEKRPKVRGGAQKFALGAQAQTLTLNQKDQPKVIVETNRPIYEALLLEIKPDAVIGDVFCLDLALPIRLKREKKLIFSAGLFYFHRDYSPSQMVDFITGRASQVPEVSMVREWSQKRQQRRAGMP